MKRTARLFRHIFIPHQGNNFRSGATHPVGVLGVLGVFLLLQIVLQFGIISPGPKILGYAANISIEEVIRLTNEKRREHGLPPLTENKILSEEAGVKGKHMLQYDYWAHVAPDGTEPWYFFHQGGYKYRYAGENLARDFSTASAAVEAWMASPTHRENILSDKYREIGIGVVEGDLAGVDTTLIVQFMGTKFTDTLPVQPVAQNKNQLATPSPTSAPIAEAKISAPKPIKLSPFGTTQGFSFAVVGFLVSVFSIDAFVTAKKRIHRSGGKFLAHFAFLGMIAAVALILKAGSVI